MHRNNIFRFRVILPALFLSFWGWNFSYAASVNLSIKNPKPSYQVRDTIQFEWTAQGMQDFNISYTPLAPNSWINSMYPEAKSRTNTNTSGVYSWEVPRDVNNMDLHIFTQGYSSDGSGYIKTEPIKITIGAGDSGRLGDLVPKDLRYNQNTHKGEFSICNISDSQFVNPMFGNTSISFDVVADSLTKTFVVPRALPLQPGQCIDADFDGADLQINGLFSKTITVHVDVTDNGDSRYTGVFAESSETNNSAQLLIPAFGASPTPSSSGTSNSCQRIDQFGRGEVLYFTNNNGHSAANTAGRDYCIDESTVAVASCGTRGVQFNNKSCQSGHLCSLGRCIKLEKQTASKPAYGISVIHPMPSKRFTHGDEITIEFYANGIEYMNIEYMETSRYPIKHYESGTVHNGVHTLTWDTSELRENTIHNGVLELNYPEAPGKFPQKTIEVPIQIMPSRSWFPKIISAQLSEDKSHIDIRTTESNLPTQKIHVETQVQGGKNWSAGGTQWDYLGVSLTKDFQDIGVVTSITKNNQSVSVGGNMSLAVDGAVFTENDQYMQNVLDTYGYDGTYRIDIALCLREQIPVLTSIDSPLCGEPHSYYLSFDGPVVLGGGARVVPPTPQAPSVQPKQPVVAPSPYAPHTTDFPDVPSTGILADAVHNLVDRGIIQGNPDGTFAPDRLVNRAEATKMLILLKHGEAQTDADGQWFPDVPPSAWFRPYVNKARTLNILKGYPDGNFHPGRTINKAELTKILSETFGLEDYLADPFQDVVGHEWYAKYVGAADKYKLYPEHNGTQFDAEREITRADIAIALHQIIVNGGLHK